MTGLLRVRLGPWLRTQGCAVGQFAGEAQHLRPQCGDQHRRRLHTGWHAGLLLDAIVLSAHLHRPTGKQRRQHREVLAQMADRMGETQAETGFDAGLWLRPMPSASRFQLDC